MATKYINIEEPDLPIPVGHLIIGTRLPCKIFIKEANTFKVFLSKDSLHTKMSQNILSEKGISEVYINAEDSMTFDFYLAGNRASHQTLNGGGPVVFKEYAHRKEEYHQIDTALVAAGSSINFGLSVLDKFKFTPLVEASDTFPFVVDESVLDIDGDVVIKKSDVPRYLDYIAALQYPAKLPEGDKAKIRAVALRETSKIVLQNFLADPKSGETIKEMHTLVNDMIDCIMQDRDTIYTLLSLKGYDYYTYTHSVNVAALSVALGVAIDLPRDDLEKLGIGAMFHDVGKSRISHEILNKQGRLSDIEYTVIKNHVNEGEKIVSSHANFPCESLGAVLQHHEKLTGRGYPLGLSGAEISLFGRISAIADCYDALTTRRPYKVAYTPFYALSAISKDTGDYDADLLRTFIKMLGKMNM
ncbi:MAG: HD domain-containing protein [Nitrospirae bacterium]|nr:HD domain-containing protein [Nitrospirota bacterium]